MLCVIVCYTLSCLIKKDKKGETAMLKKSMKNITAYAVSLFFSTDAYHEFTM